MRGEEERGEQNTYVVLSVEKPFGFLPVISSSSETHLQEGGVRVGGHSGGRRRQRRNTRRYIDFAKRIAIGIAMGTTVNRISHGARS